MWVQQHVKQSGGSLMALVAPFLHIPTHVAAAHKEGASLKQRKGWLQVRGLEPKPLPRLYVQ